MKILFVLTYYRPYWTGLTQYAARVAEGLANRSHEVSVVCTQHDKKLPFSENINKVEVKRTPFLFRFSRSVISLKFPFQVLKEMLKNETVIAYLPLQEIIFITMFAKLFRKKLYLVHNGDLVLPREGGILNRILEKVYYLSSAFAIKNSEGIVVHTEDYAENSKLLSRYKQKWIVAQPPVLIPKINQADMDDFKKIKKIPKKRLIGFSGRFVEEKGIEFLLDAIPLVLKKVSKAHFVLAGQYKVGYENYWARISSKIEKNKINITLVGLLDDKKEIFVFDKILDVFVQPSLTDCFPLGQIEAMLLGAPSVCSDIPGARWAIKQTGMGVLVQAADPNSLATGIVEVINNKEEYQKNWEKMREIFNYEKSIDRFERIFIKGQKNN